MTIGFHKSLCRVLSLHRSCHRKCSIKNLLLKILQYSQENICGSLFAGLQVCNFINEIHKHLCFLGSIVKLWKIPFWRAFANNCFSFRNNSSKKKIKINGKPWVFSFINWHSYKEKFKEVIYKSKQIPGGKLSHLIGTKYNFHT